MPRPGALANWRCDHAARIPVNDLSRGWIATSPEVRDAVARVLSSGWFLNGPEVAELERDLETRLNVDNAIGVASGTDALALALQAVGCGGQAEVVTAANAGGYASVAAAQIGAPVAYADVDPRTLLLTAEGVAAAIGPATRAVVVTHLYGNVATVDEVVELCRPRGIAVVEDCAQAFGAELGGRPVGSIGDVAAISFYPTKTLGAAGDAGAVVTASKEIASAVRSLRQYGWSGKYRIEQAGGRNSRLDEIQAAVLRVGLAGVDEHATRRRAIVEAYSHALPQDVGRMVSGATPGYVAHLAVARVRDRERFRRHLDERGIDTDIHYPVPDHCQPGLATPARTLALPESERAATEVVTLPCFPEMTHVESDAVTTAIAEFQA